MSNVRIVVEYDGTDFFGWQQQPGKRTVQGELESVLAQITGETIALTGAGRTDQGVHALGQVANFHTAARLGPEAMMKAVNSMTGDDLHVREAGVVPDDFNSRYSARGKLYEYRIIFEPSPFARRYTWHVKQPLDAAHMRAALPALIARRDYAGFSVRNGPDNTVCDVRALCVEETSAGLLFRIEGDRFLRKMVRGIVGFLVDVGRGRFAAETAEEIFSGGRQDINFAPAQGLFLVSVYYEHKD